MKLMNYQRILASYCNCKKLKKSQMHSRYCFYFRLHQFVSLCSVKFNIPNLLLLTTHKLINYHIFTDANDHVESKLTPNFYVELNYKNKMSHNHVVVVV